MSKSPITLLLLRRLTLTSRNNGAQLCPLRHQVPSGKPFSTSSPDPPKPSSLSARLSFVFDQIDAIERERTEKDQTLQRIRAWRQSKDAARPSQDVAISSDNDGDRRVEPGLSVSVDDDSGASLAELNKEGEEGGEVKEKGKEVVEVAHPWPEWIELMERLVKQNYFDHRRKDEDKMVRELGLDVGGVGSDVGVQEAGAGVDFIKDVKAVQNACLNFGKDRFDILRPLSRKDIQILVGYGCPSSDKKVVFSSKLLRKHAHLDEGDVCSNCSLRSSCERAYLLTNKEDEARTIDVMRVMLAYGLDHVHGTITNKPLLKQKSLKIVVRKLLHEIVKLSAVPIDPNLPPPIIKKPPPKVKQPPPPPKKRVGRDDIEMKKGDWLCPKCDFMNFSKNTVCLQCDAKRPKRQLLPGEWECPECNFLNYRRNLVCFHCECKRPPDEFVEARMEERQNSARIRPEKMSRRPEVSDAWNNDFDDNESDGADVAAFEYADSGAKSPGYPANDQAEGGNFRGRDADIGRASRTHKIHEQEHSDPDHIRPRMGFDDFDDEDDVDSYEVDTHSRSPSRKGSQDEFYGRGISDLEESYSDDDMDAPPRSNTQSFKKFSTSKNQKTNFSGFGDLDADSDEELSGHSEWRSSHVADTKYKSASRGPKGPPRKLSYGSDEDMDLGSDDDLDDNFGSTRGEENKQMYKPRNLRNSDQEDVSLSGSDSDDARQFRTREEQIESGRRNYDSTNRGRGHASRNLGVRSRGKMGRSSWDDESDRSSHRSLSREYDRGEPRMNSRPRNLSNSREARGQDFPNRRRESPSRHAGRGFGGFGNSDEGSLWDDDLDRPPRSSYRGSRNNDVRRMSNKPGNSRDFRGSRQQGSGRGRPREHGRDTDSDFGEFKNSRRVIER